MRLSEVRRSGYAIPLDPNDRELGRGRSARPPSACLRQVIDFHFFVLVLVCFFVWCHAMIMVRPKRNICY